MTTLSLLAADVTSAPQWIEDKRLVRPHQLGALVAWASAAPVLCFDYEGGGQDEGNALDTKRGARSFMAGFYAPDKGAKVVDFRLTGEAGLQAVRDAMSRRTGLTIGHNLKHEVHHSEALGFRIGGKLWDNQAAFFAVDEREKALSQDALVRKYLKRGTPQWDALRSWMEGNLGTSRRGHELNPMALEVPYNCEDVTDSWDLYQYVRPLVEQQGLLDVVEVDGELIRAICDMESTGLRFDQTRAEQLIAEFGFKLGTTYRRIRELVGHDVDIASSEQLFRLFYGELKLPMYEEKAGSLDDEVLHWFLDQPQATDRVKEIIRGVDLWIELDKLKGTYLLPWTYEHQLNGRLHPNLNQNRVRTRRFSGRSPNLQNVPNRTELGRLLRECILADEGWTTYSADYSQVEYRCFGHYSGEPSIIRAYQSNPLADFHEEIARLLNMLRKDAKHINFGILYGMGLVKLARKLRCSVERAKQLMDQYYARIPTLKNLRQKLEAEIRRTGKVTNIFGARRHLTPTEGHIALNSLCQGTAGDMMRRAMVRALPVVRDAGGNLLLQIHDDLKFRLPGRDVEAHRPVIEEVKRVMGDFPMFKVPMPVDVQYYQSNWASKVQYDKAA